MSPVEIADAVAELARSFKDSTPNTKYDNKANLRDTIEQIKTVSKHCFDLSDDAVEIAVKIAGIHANASITLLTGVGKDVADNVGALQSDIEANITSAKGLLTSCQSDYNTTMESLASAKYLKYAKGLAYPNFSLARCVVSTAHSVPRTAVFARPQSAHIRALTSDQDSA